MKIGVYSNVNKDPDGKVKRAVFDSATAHGISAEEYEDGAHYDFAVTIGGDGTILRVIKACAKSGIPVLGINLGTVGFLAETEPSAIDEAFSRLVRRDYILERRSLLDVSVKDKREYALNDAVVMRVGSGRAATVDLSINGDSVDSIVCDGFVVSTPTGSTAYSLSAGGSIIAPGLPVIALTPLNPHTLRARPIIVGSGDKIGIKCRGDGRIMLYADGNDVTELSEHDEVIITGWDMSALFVRFGYNGFYSKLLNKLGTR